MMVMSELNFLRHQCGYFSEDSSKAIWTPSRARRGCSLTGAWYFMTLVEECIPTVQLPFL